MATDLPYDLTRLARWCAGLLLAIVGMEVLFGLVMVYSLFEINQSRGGQLVETVILAGDTYRRSDLAIMAVALPYTLAYVAALVSNGIWIFRASSNAAEILPSDSRIKPGWAIGWFFVPFANLWMPFRAMRETWNSSMSAQDGLEAKLPGWMTLWWMLWVVSNILAQISQRMAQGGGDLDAFATSNVIDIANAGLGVIVALYFRRIILEVSAAQSLSQRRMEEVFA